jgi:hypothetical protein
VLGPVGVMTGPTAIVAEDNADSFVDQVIDETLSGPAGGSSEKDQDKDSGDSNSPPNFWLGPINTGPVSFGKRIDDPVTSGSDAVGNAPTGVVDNPGSSQ